MHIITCTSSHALNMSSPFVSLSTLHGVMINPVYRLTLFYSLPPVSLQTPHLHAITVAPAYLPPFPPFTHLRKYLRAAKSGYMGNRVLVEGGESELCRLSVSRPLHPCMSASGMRLDTAAPALSLTSDDAEFACGHCSCSTAVV
jgi:hypothetical protein